MDNLQWWIGTYKITIVPFYLSREKNKSKQCDKQSTVEY